MDEGDKSWVQLKVLESSVALSEKFSYELRNVETSIGARVDRIETALSSKIASNTTRLTTLETRVSCGRAAVTAIVTLVSFVAAVLSCVAFFKG